MKKKTWIAALGGAGIAGFMKYRQLTSVKEIPGKVELSAYFDELFDMAGLADVRGQFQEDWIENDGLRLHLDLFLSKESDPAVVFVPGTSAYALLYVEFMHKLRLEGFNVIGLDPRGHGRSEGRRGSYTVDELIRDARAATDYAINKFGEKVGMCGSSQGGIVTFYAAASDERLKAVACHNIAVLSEPESIGLTRAPRFSSIASHLLPLARFFGEVLLPVSVYLNLKIEHIKYGGNAIDFLKNDPLALMSVSMKALASLSSAPLQKPVEEITAPVMVLQGEFDNIFSMEYTKKIFERLTCEKEFLILEGAPHLIMTNNVDELMPYVTAWLGDHLK